MVRKRLKIECPYLGTVRRDLLDFDKLHECSQTLSTIDVYCCLICGIFLRGKSLQSPAGVHSLETDHHLYISLEDSSVVCLPDNYEVLDATLDDVRQNCRPTYQNIPFPVTGRAVDGSSFVSGVLGLHNLGQTDYLNAVVQLIVRVPEIARVCLLRHQIPKTISASLSLLAKKLFNPMSFKAAVCPQEFALSVQRLSNGAFGTKKQADPQVFLTWLLNTLYKESKPLAQLFRGKLQTHSKQTSFFHLPIELVQFEKYGAETSQNLESLLEQFAVTKAPKYLLIYIRRFQRNRFFLEKLKTEVRWPSEFSWSGRTWSWLGTIEHVGPAEGGKYKSYVVHGGLTYEAADLNVAETLLASVASPYILLYS